MVNEHVHVHILFDIGEHFSSMFRAHLIVHQENFFNNSRFKFNLNSKIDIKLVFHHLANPNWKMECYT